LVFTPSPLILTNYYLPFSEALCVQGIMRPELKQQLEKEISKGKHKNFRAWSIVFLVLIILIWLVIGFSSKSSVPVNGIAISQHASLREDGHKIYLMVKVPERETLVKVSLPKHLPIKRNVKVELRKHQSTLFNTFRYTFVRYLE
jgi:hypothetical protein